MDLQDRKRYAETLIELLSLQEGQGLFIKGDPEGWDLMSTVAEVAYRAGARHVVVEADSPSLVRARLDHSHEQYLTEVPATYAATRQVYMDEGWAVISFQGSSDPDLFATVDAGRLGAHEQAYAEASTPFRRALQQNQQQWIVAPSPTAKWAAQVVGEANADALWEILKPVLRLDSDDPASAWRARRAEIEGRSAQLNKNPPRRLHFRGPGTDFVVGLTTRSRFIGGGVQTNGGIRFMPNIPTEEVFTAPDRRIAEGRVRVTRPVRVFERSVHGAWFEFKDGAVVDFGADYGKEMLQQFLDVDEGARRIGELALVDTASPVFKSGKVFSSILLDENAASHIALGAAYPACIEGHTSLGHDELQALGVNVGSKVHRDFMIGSDEVDVEAEYADGTGAVLMKKGEFVGM